LLLKLVGVDDRNGIEALRNSLLYCDVDVEEKSENPDEYHFQQLIGCAVELEDGSNFGKVKEVLDLPAQAVLVIESKGSEVMVPFVKVWVPSVDIANK
jgi:16S rRNA processing protein RimM